MPNQAAFLAIAEELDEMAGHVGDSVARVTAGSEGVVVGGSLHDRLQRMVDDAAAHRDAISGGLAAGADVARQRAAVCRQYTEDMAEYRARFAAYEAMLAASPDQTRDSFMVPVPVRPASWCEEG